MRHMNPISLWLAILLALAATALVVAVLLT